MALCYISPGEHSSHSFICSLGQHLSDSGVQALSPDSELWVAVGAATRRTNVPVLNSHVPTEGKVGALLHPLPGAQLTPGPLGPHLACWAQAEGQHWTLRGASMPASSLQRGQPVPTRSASTCPPGAPNGPSSPASPSTAFKLP